MLAALVLLGGLFLVVTGLLVEGRTWQCPLGGIWLVLGAGLWLRRRWARWLTMGLFAALALWNGYETWRLGFSWLRALPIACAVVFCWRVRREFAPAAEPDDDPPMTSLVLLLREPRYLDCAILAQAASSAWGGDYEALTSDKLKDHEHDDAQRYVLGESPHLIVRNPEGLFIVHTVPAPYFEDSEKLADSLGEARLRKVLEDHRAWLSVDLLGPLDPSVARESFYPQIARLIAELAGPDCLGIVRPETGAINVYDASMDQKLRGPNPLADMLEPLDAPVIEVPDDDPRMKAAVAEARRRWPEFVEAFGHREEGQHFSVKVPITAGARTEFIWVEVKGIAGGVIFGNLGNDPVDLGDLKDGDPVEVLVKDLNDWCYLKDGQPVGLFTWPVFERILANRRAKDK